jgi:hypothetical protein
MSINNELQAPTKACYETQAVRGRQADASLYPYYLRRSKRSCALCRCWFKTRPAVTGRPMTRRTIVPALSELGEGLAGQDVLVPSHDSIRGAGRGERVGSH